MQKDTSEQEESYCVAFPPLIQFMYNIGKLLYSSPWAINDIKQGNFKLNLAGKWEIIDYGGHYPKILPKKNTEFLLGSNDYASYTLFHILNSSSPEQFSKEVGKFAYSDNSRWFSLVKVIIRMLTGKNADNLRGSDLNQVLFSNFEGYHEKIFIDILDKVLYRRDSEFHYRNFSLVKRDVASFFEDDNNPGLEIALRRFLFLIGLSITGNYAWSILDKDLKDRLIISYSNKKFVDSTWKVGTQDNKIIITENI